MTFEFLDCQSEGSDGYAVNTTNQRWKAVTLLTPNHLGREPFTMEECEAYGRLFAAAPDLYNAIKDYMRRHPTYSCEDQVLLAAIAKAEGKS